MNRWSHAVLEAMTCLGDLRVSWVRSLVVVPPPRKKAPLPPQRAARRPQPSLSGPTGKIIMTFRRRHRDELQGIPPDVEALAVGQ